MNLWDFEAIDWDDEEDEEGNLAHCLRHGIDERVVDSVLSEEPVEIKMRVEIADFAIVGPDRGGQMWTLLFDWSFKRGDWLRPVTGWRSELEEIAEWERGRETAMSNRGQRESEREKREAAQRHRGQVVEGSGRPIEGRHLPQMVSVRLDPNILSDLRELARSRGASVSDLLREGAALVTSQAQAVSFQIRISRIDTFLGVSRGETSHATSTAAIERAS